MHLKRFYVQIVDLKLKVITMIYIKMVILETYAVV